MSGGGGERGIPAHGAPSQAVPLSPARSERVSEAGLWSRAHRSRPSLLTTHTHPHTPTPTPLRLLPHRYEHIGQGYGPGCDFIVLRATSAAFSTGTCLLMYFIARKWGGSVYGGILASVLTICDFLNLTEGRLILLDSQLMFWIMATLLSAQGWWARWNEDHAGVRPFKPRERAAWAAWIGCVCALAFGCKMTALATPGIIAVESFFAIFFLKVRPGVHTPAGVRGQATAWCREWVIHT